MRRIIIGLAIATIGFAPAGAAPPSLPSAPVIAIAQLHYVPSGYVHAYQATQQSLWVQQVRRGDVIEIRNLEYTFPTLQHTVTQCATGCVDMPDTEAPRPLPGGFDVGPLSYAGGEGRLDTAGMAPGLYEYFCKPHPWMRGSFEVVELI